MLCPLMSFQKPHVNDIGCYEMDCAWFCPDSQMCAIKKIALKDELIIPVAKEPYVPEVSTRLLDYGS